MMTQPSKEEKELWKKFDACKDKNKKKEILRQIDELTAKESVENDLFSRINLEHFNKLLDTVQKNKYAVYTLVDKNGTNIKAIYVSDYQSHNGLGADEVGYEEFKCIVFQKCEDKSLFEISYHNLPVHILVGEYLIF